MRRLLYVVTFLLLQAAITAEAALVPIAGITQGSQEVVWCDIYSAPRLDGHGSDGVDV